LSDSRLNGRRGYISDPDQEGFMKDLDAQLYAVSVLGVGPRAETPSDDKVEEFGGKIKIKCGG
jgi:hypothetical protein